MSTPHEPPDGQPDGQPTDPQPGWGQQPPPGQPGYGQPGYGYPAYPVAPPTHPSAGTALGLAIFALIGGLACALPLFAAPFAWGIGKRTLSEIDANPGQWGGRDLANTGYIIGIVGTVLLIVALLVIVAVAALVVITS